MFDPYHKWLGIPQHLRPPTHYQILGIAPDEQDGEVIEEAAIRQTTHVRTYQIGPHGRESTRLLHEIAQARATLLSPAKRRDYDAALRRTSAPRADGPPPRPESPIRVAPPAATPADLFRDLGAPETYSGRGGRHPQRARRKQSRYMPAAGTSLWKVGLITAAAGAPLLALALALPFLLRGEPAAPPHDAAEVAFRPDPKPLPPGPQPAGPEARPGRTDPPAPEVKSDPTPARASPLDNLGHDRIAAADRHAPFGRDLVAVLQGHKGQVWGLAFAPDGARLATASEDGTVLLWDLTGPEPRRRAVLRGEAGALYAVTFSPDGGRVAFSTRDGVQIWEVANPETPPLRIRFGGEPEPKSIAWSPGGRLVAFGRQARVFLADPQAGRVLEPGIREGGGVVSRVAFSADGARLACAKTDGRVWIWDVDGVVFTLKRQFPAPPTPGAPNGATGLAFAPDGQTLAVSHLDGSLRLWELGPAGGRVRYAVNGHVSYASSVTFAPDGQTLLTTGGSVAVNLKPRAVLWRSADGGKLREWELPERSLQGTFDPTGRYVALACHNHRVYIVRVSR